MYCTIAKESYSMDMDYSHNSFHFTVFKLLKEYIKQWQLIKTWVCLHRMKSCRAGVDSFVERSSIYNESWGRFKDDTNMCIC